jgi:hypothetical protein
MRRTTQRKIALASQQSAPCTNTFVLYFQLAATPPYPFLTEAHPGIQLGGALVF